MYRKQVWFWGTELDKGRTDVPNEQISVFSSTSTTDDNVYSAEVLIQDDRRIHATSIVQELRISIGSADNIMHEQFGYRKTCSRWVLRYVTEKHKAM